ncbi:hypothetical protein MC885_010015 [Smutsia gigantea]|nr:hypothetical protein MC885_010015 [Smutsia gigantea]
MDAGGKVQTADPHTAAACRGVAPGPGQPGSRCGPAVVPPVCAHPHLWDGAMTNLSVPLAGPHDTSNSPLCGRAQEQPVAHLSLSSLAPRLLLVTSLAAMLLQEVGSASMHQVLVKTKGNVGPPEQNTEEAWGALAAEPLDGGWLRGLLTAPGLVATAWKTQQGAMAWVGTEDALGRVLSPRQGPDPDPEDRYHPWPEEAQDEAQLWSWVLPSRQELQGPEEDRDHIYHPRGTSWGP